MKNIVLLCVYLNLIVSAIISNIQHSPTPHRYSWGFIVHMQWQVQHVFVILVFISRSQQISQFLCRCKRWKQRAGKTSKFMCADGEWMPGVMASWQCRVSQGQEHLSLPISLRRLDSVRLTWHGFSGRAQVILGYPGEAPVPFRNASSCPAIGRFTCNKRQIYIRVCFNC